MNVEEMMTPEQRALITQPKAWENTRRVMGFPLGATPFQMTGHFHTVMKMETPDAPILPSVSLRERRLRLILEEFLELVEAMGFEMTVGGHTDFAHSELGVKHVEGSRYDVVETADALGDMNVVVNGTGVDFGIPMHFIDYEVYTSNLSKVDAGGNVIVNHCRTCQPEAPETVKQAVQCEDETHELLRPDAPIGKILKPDSFVPCNIPAVLVAFQNKEI